jgi:uncharacterized damage-inducible protein DinB
MTPEFAAGYRQLLCESLSSEMQITNKVLAAVPESKKDYRPDPLSRTAFELAWHVVSSEVQMMEEVADMKFTLEPRFKDEPKTMAEMIRWYETHFKAAIERVQAMTAAQLATPVDFYGAYNLPDVIYLGFVHSHSIHHRGQLCAYLRPMGGKVPSIYGGSADDPWEPGKS